MLTESGARTGGNAATGAPHGHRDPSGVAGFTLIEITIAAALFTFLAFVTAEAYPFLGLNALAGRDQTFAARFAQQQVEDLKLRSYSAITASNGVVVTATSGSQCRSISPTCGVLFTATITAQNCGSSAQPECTTLSATENNLTLISVVVTWVDPSAPGTPTNPQTRTYTLTTLRHNWF